MYFSGSIFKNKTMKSFFNYLTISLLLLSVNINLFAQKTIEEEIIAPNVPISAETKLVTYTEVVDSKGTATEINEKALNWFNSYYKNSANILRKNENGSFTGHPRFKILNQKDKKGIETMAGTVVYDINIASKDGKFKYEITNIFLTQATKFPIERWIDKNSATYQKSYDYYLLQTDNNFKEVIKSLKDFMASTSVKKSEEW